MLGNFDPSQLQLRAVLLSYKSHQTVAVCLTIYRIIRLTSSEYISAYYQLEHTHVFYEQIESRVSR